MAASQTILFTVVPRGIAVNADRLPVSVLVSPRLQGATRLGDFPDWLRWTRHVKDRGLVLTFRSDGRSQDRAVDTAPLRPELWEALFDRDTLVHPRTTIDDYSEHGIISFSARESLSAIKAVYMEASVVLALPDDGREGKTGHGSRNRAALSQIVDGLDVHWDPRKGKRWREVVRHRFGSREQSRSLVGPLDEEGLIAAPRDRAAFQAVAVPFSVFHHMPTPERHEDPVTHEALKIDPKAIDFHQAIGSFGSYPALLRALGLVFDLELPLDLVAQTPPGGTSTLAIARSNVDWRVPTASPPLDTACAHFTVDGNRFFFTAPRDQNPTAAHAQVIGLVNLDPARFGLAQVDFDGGMHKVTATAETTNNPDSERNRDPHVRPLDAPHPEIYDPQATLPALRSGGLQLYVDGRGRTVLDAVAESKKFQTALETGGTHRPFFAEDLVRGYRLDVWDSRSGKWHSLHRRTGRYRIGEAGIPFDSDEEGFFELAATQPAKGANPADKDLYVHEAIARWAGWSLSAQMPGKALTRHADPAKALNHAGDVPDEPITPYKVAATYKVVPGSLPRLRFGARYRVRLRAVDLCGNSLELDEPVAAVLGLVMGLPRDPEGMAFLRYEPVGAPQVVIRDEQAIRSPGSALDRLVIRTFNDATVSDVETADATAADLAAADRHLLPPRTSVEMGERLGMFDDATGKLKSDAATWKLAVERDAGELPHVDVEAAGKTQKTALVPGDTVDPLPYLPDPLSRGAALRDLPGSASSALARVAPGAGAATPIAYTPLDDVNPRPGSATLVAFDDAPGADWQQRTGIRLALGEPAPGAIDPPPQWDPAARVLTVFLPKGRTAVTPLSSFVDHDDLALLGIWHWLREFVDRVAIFGAQRAQLLPGFPVDRIAHVLQRAVEGGHWMLTPPTLLTLVHAVQQPIGRPAFAALQVDHRDRDEGPNPMQTARLRGRKDPVELAPITAWRRLGETHAHLLGALRVHGASTAKVDLRAEWTDPVDDDKEPKPGSATLKAHVEELPLPTIDEDYLRAPGAEYRPVGWYDPEHDQIAMVREGDRAAKVAEGARDGDLIFFRDAAPRHLLNDTKRHLITYEAVSTSRYREYFADQTLDFTRRSDAVTVDVPASARPLAPDVVYVVPTFGWQRQTATNMKRSVRYGGGLRVYLRRPWYSSGVGELLGVTLWSDRNGTLDDKVRESFKGFFTQWGMDPIWQTAPLAGAPAHFHFPDAAERDLFVSLEEPTALLSPGVRGHVDVVGFQPEFDAERQLWFADLTIDAGPVYSPFVRLALVRYQPHALDDARISPVVVADFAQLTPDRVALVTADPHHPRTLRVTISGTAPQGPVPAGPAPIKPPRPTHVRVRVQKRTGVKTDLGWEDAPVAEATVTQFYEGQAIAQPDLALWVGAVTFTAPPPPDTYRLLVQEFEHVSASYAEAGQAPGRLIYAETFSVDAGLVKA